MINLNLDKSKIFDKKIVIFTVGITLIIIGSIFILIKFRFVNLFNLNNLGELGDTIGGIAGPIINLLGAILVYKSFLIQIEANRIQLENIEQERSFNSLWELYKESKNDIYNFEYLYIRDNTQNVVLKGFHSFDRLIIELKNNYVNVISRRKFIINNIISILQNFSIIYKKINNSNISFDDKYLLNSKMNYLFSSQLENYIKEIIDLLKDSEIELIKSIQNEYDKIVIHQSKTII
ncbi:MAG: hypothetical protein ACOYO1_12825 [Bacteroidales bacterium]